MRIVLLITLVTSAIGCSNPTTTMTTDMSDVQLEEFFRNHTVLGMPVAGLKKRSLGTVAYLATVHGFPNNLSVCEELIKPYNDDASKSDIPGDYFCEEIR